MMSKEKRRVPKLRFPGFTEDWEQRKLSELATMNARIGWQNLRTSEFLDSGDYLLITGTDFDNGRIKYNTCHYVEKKRFDQDTKIQLSTGSILITKDGTLGKVALIEELPKPATLNAGVFNVRVKDDAVLSYKYLYHYLKAPFLMKYVTANATGGTIKHLNQSILVDFPIPITEKQEQDRIAKLLDSLESIITLHQRKLDNLKLKKKALLQKLFPRNGEQYPELRFPGFTDAWEQRKLSDISTKVTRKNVNVHYTETLTNSAEQGIISQVDFFDKEISNKDNINGYYIVDNNDFIYNPRISTLAPVGPINRNKLNRTGIMSPLYTVFRSSNVDLGFLEWYFQSSHWHRYMKLKGDSGARADRIAIKDSTFFEMPIKIPVNIKEQVLIGETLEKFNQYITLHQRKLEHLQIQKKSLLQKLFV